MTVVNATPSRLRFRHSGSTWLAAIIVLVFATPFAGGVFLELDDLSLILLAPLAVIMVGVPLLIAIWSLRSGVNVSTDGITVRALIGSRRLDWSQVRGFDAEGQKVYALLEGDRRLELPSVRPSDLPRLIEVGGGELITDDTATDVPDEPADQ